MHGKVMKMKIVLVVTFSSSSNLFVVHFLPISTGSFLVDIF